MELALQLSAIVATRDWLTLASILPLAVRVGKCGKRFAEICGCRYCSRTSVPALDWRADGGSDRALVRGIGCSVSILTVRTILHVR